MPEDDGKPVPAVRTVGVHPHASSARHHDLRDVKGEAASLGDFGQDYPWTQRPRRVVECADEQLQAGHRVNYLYRFPSFVLLSLYTLW